MAPKGKTVGYAAIGTGLLLTWSALFNKSILQTVQDVIKGTKPQPGPAEASPASSSNSPAANAAIIAGATGNTGAQGKSAAENQALAKKLAIPFGWSGGQQWTCLVELWNQESGWSNIAENPSGAYGIAQALPNTKYPLPGRPPSEGGSANATVQIIWGLGYILTRYGSPCSAWAHEESNGWY